MRGIRRGEKEITDSSEMARVLNEAKYITIAMTDVDGPYLASLTHVYDEKRNAIYFHCAQEGRKVDILRRDNRVWGQALIDLGYVEGKCDHLYESTQFKGRAVFVQGIQVKRRALEAMIRKNDRNPDAVIGAQLTEESLARVNIGRIDIEYMSGKRSNRVIVSL